MEKIKKGLEEKLNLINKIKNNLKIKKYQLKKIDKQPIEFPIIDKSPNPQKQNLILNEPQVKTPEQQITSWINIKKLTKDPEQLAFLTPNLSSRNSSTSFEDKILLTNTYTSRFASKNSLMKLVQFKSITKDKSKANLSLQMLRKTFLEKTSRTFSPEKMDKKFIGQRRPPQQPNFFGKMNQINHVSGIRFKTLDPRFGGLTRQELKQKIRNRQTGSVIDIINNNFDAIPISPTLSPRISESLNLYEIESSLQQKQHRSSIHAYNFSPYENNKHQGRRSRKKKGPPVKDRYSPWNQNSSEQVLWDELPKIK